MKSVVNYSSFPHLVADWPAPSGVKAIVTTRALPAQSVTDDSHSPYSFFNIADHVGDCEQQIEQNRQTLQDVLKLDKPIQWLQQVHGCDVYDARADGHKPQADAIYTSEPGLACAVMTADCLPVFFCDQSGKEIAVAHAGWRGLADGVLEATVARFSAGSSQLMAWFGPAIGLQQFEVGGEVRDIFLTGVDEIQQKNIASAFVENSLRGGYYYADIYSLARQRLQQVGVEKIYGGGMCTYSDVQRFYSYRRDGVTGRMASIIYLADN